MADTITYDYRYIIFLLKKDKARTHTAQVFKSDEIQTELREMYEEELKKIVEDRKKWVGSDEKEGKRADLEHTAAGRT